jgi:hypothetical protein
MNNFRITFTILVFFYFSISPLMIFQGSGFIQSTIQSMTPMLPSLIMNTWIAPHGATDLIHAIHHNTTDLLTTSYCGTIVLGQLCHSIHQDHFFYGLFGLASFLHFYDDWKRLNNPILASVITGSILTTFVQSSWLPFYLYMSFHHVPFHYIQVWPVIRQYKIPTILLLSSTTFAITLFTGKNNLANLITSIDNLGIWLASIVIGHIVYGIQFNTIVPFSKDKIEDV